MAHKRKTVSRRNAKGRFARLTRKRNAKGRFARRR